MCFRPDMAGIIEKRRCERIQYLKTSVTRDRLPNGWNCHAVKPPSRTEQKI